MGALELCFLGLAVVGVGAAGFGLHRVSDRRNRLRKAWLETAQREGLTDIWTSSPAVAPIALQGRAGARFVRFETYKHHGEREGTRVVIRGKPGITMKVETLGTALEKVVGIRELQLGDEAFDRDVHLQGLPEVLRAVLDAETRSIVRELVRVHRVSVLDGEVCAEMSARAMEEQFGWLAALLKDLLDLARRLDRPDDLALRIAENTRHEPEWRVRLENLLLLVETFPQHFASRETLERARGDEHPEVRIRAALASEDEGLATLLEMASLRSTDDAYAARAVLALGDRLPPDSAEEILGRALRGRQVETATACLDRLGRAGGPAIVAVLAKVLAVEEGALGVAAARALGASGASAAEAPLLRSMAEAPPDVAAAVAEALGDVGSANAVLPLKEAAARDDASGRLQRAVRQAIAEIQARLQGASPGQLSIAEGESGQVSLVEDHPSGRVSLTDRGGAP